MTITLAAVYTPDRLPGRADRRAVPRVRLHAGRRGVHLRRRGADAVADDVVAAARAPSTQHGLVRAARSIAPSTRLQRGYARALDATLRDAAGGLRRLDRALAAGRADVHVLAAGARADRGPGRRLRRHRRAGQRDARAARRRTPTQVNEIFKSTPEFEHSFQITFPTGGFGGMVVKPWDERKRSIFPIQDELIGKLVGITGVRAPVFLPPALPERRASFPVEFVIASTGEPRGAAALRRPARAGGDQERPVRLPARSSTCSIDQAKAEIVHRPRQGRVDGPQHAAGRRRSRRRCSAATSSTASTSTGAATRSSRRSSAPAGSTPSSSTDIHVTGPNGQLIPLGAIATLQQRRRAAHAQPLPAAQRRQDLRRRDRGRSTAALQRARGRGREDPAAGLPRRLHRRVAPAAAGGRQVPARDGPGALLIFLVLAAQFNSFRDPFVILAGSVPLAMFGALIFTFLKFAGPPGMTLRAHRGLDDHAQHLLAGRPGHAGRPGRRRTAS